MCVCVCVCISLVAQTVRETGVQSLGHEDSPEEGNGNLLHTLAWKIPWTEEAGRLQAMGLHRVGHDWVTLLSFSLSYIYIYTHMTCIWASFVAQLVKKPPAMWETWVQSLGWEDSLEKGKLSSPVFWPGEFHGLYSPWGRKESDMTE